MVWRRTFAAMAKLVIVIVSTNDCGNGNHQKSNFVLNEKLFQHQENKPKTEN